MDFDDQLRRYFGTADIATLSPGALAAGAAGAGSAIGAAGAAGAGAAAGGAAGAGAGVAGAVGAGGVVVGAVCANAGVAIKTALVINTCFNTISLLVFHIVLVSDALASASLEWSSKEPSNFDMGPK